MARRRPVGAHHRDVRPRDRQDAGRAVGAADTATTGPRPSSAGPASAEARGWLGRYGARWARTADRADARAAAAVGDAEGLVQVEVAHVGAELPGPGHADEGVEVGAVEVHLAAGVVHERRRCRRWPSSNTPWVDG